MILATLFYMQKKTFVRKAFVFNDRMKSPLLERECSQFSLRGSKETGVTGKIAPATVPFKKLLFGNL